MFRPGGSLEGFFEERERWPLWLPVLLGVGIAVYFSLRHEPPWWLGLALLLPLILVTRLLWERQGGRIAGLILLTLALGFAVAQARTSLVAATVLEQRHGPATVAGRVLQVEALPKEVRVTLERLRINRLSADRTPEKVRIRLRGTQPDLAPGDWIQVPAMLLPPPPPTLPGGFDFQRKAYFEGLGAVGYGLGTAEITAHDPATGLAAYGTALSSLRYHLGARIRAALPDSTIGGVAAALMTGDRAAIPDSAMQAMRDAGLAHLLAISGLHVGLVAGLVFFALRAVLALLPVVALRFPVKKWAAVAAILVAFGYAQMTGATVPTQRAFLMVGLVLLGVLVDRQGLSMRGLAWAASVVLLVQPESLLGPSFQMSFAAVLALVAVYEQAGRRLAAARRNFGGLWSGPLLYLAAVSLTTLVAGLATAPFAIHHFHRMASFGLLANLAAVPMTALWIMPWALLAYLLAPLGGESLALVPMGWGIEGVVRVAQTVAGMEGAVMLFPGLPGWGVAAVSLGGIWLCLWRRRWRYLGIIGLLIGGVALSHMPPPDILVDGDGKLMAARLPDGRLAFSSLRGGSFQRENWMNREAVATAVSWRGFTPDPQAALSCDPLGCILHRQGLVVALVRETDALEDDCRAADLVVSSQPVRGRCPSARLVIDRFDLWRGGSHALWLHPDGTIRVESVNGQRGDRPWVLRPDKIKKPTTAATGSTEGQGF
ncbi:ComEC/Rec2 family competence protein [Magnetospira thiophila]